MIAIKHIASGEFFDLMPGQKIPIEWESPVMKDDVVLSGIGSMPFALPFTDRNKRLCKHFELVSNAEKNVVLDVDLELGGNFWARGKLVVSIKGTTYDCDFSETLSLIEIGDKPIGEIVNDKILIDTPFKRWWACTPTGTSLTVNIAILLGYTEKNFTTTQASLSLVMDDLYSQILADSLVPLVFDIRRETQGSEEILYFEVKEDESIWQDTTLFVGSYGSVMNFNTTYYGARVDWGDYQRDLIINKITGDVSNVYPASKHCFPVIKNDDFYGENNTDFAANKLINKFYLEYLKNQNAINTYAISPQFFLFDVLDKICNYLGIELDGNLKDIEQIYQRCFIYSNTALDLITFRYPSIFIVLVNAFKQRFYEGTCMPENTIKDLLYCIQNTFNSAIIVRNNKLFIVTKKSVLNSTEIIDYTYKSFKIVDETKGCFEDGFILKYSPDGSDTYLSDHIKDISVNRKDDVNTFAELPTRNVFNGEIRLVKDENKFYKAEISTIIGSIVPKSIKWTFYSLMLHDYEYANHKKDIDSKNSQTINDDFIEDLTTIHGHIRKINVPHIYQKGNSDEFSLGYQKAPLRLIFYWGLKQGLIQTDPGNPEHVPPIPPTFGSSSADDEAYPFASIDNFDINGNQLGDYALRWNGEYGLYEKFWKEWLEFKNQSKPLTIKILLSVSDFLQIDILKKIRIRESVFIIDRIKTDIGQKDREVICIMDLYKV